MDNREAMAYVVFRAFGCSREKALSVVDELCGLFPGVQKVAAKKWRPGRARVSDVAEKEGAP